MTPAVAEFRPRRSVLYMPGSNERALEKAKTLPCDGLILDLEDAVAPDAKPAARDAACAAAASGAYGKREVTIRINGADTEWHDDDMRAVCAAGPDAIVVPKVDSADAVLALVDSMAAHDSPDRTKLWAMVETPYAMLRADEIAAASDLARGKAEGVPAVIVRGLRVEGDGTAREIVIEPELDLFS